MELKSFHIHFALVNGLKDGRKVTDRKVRIPCYRARPTQAEVGDKLFVAEAFRVHRCRPEKEPNHGYILYRSDGKYCPECGAYTRALSPRHMHQQLSRYVIEITDIQAHVLQEITDMEVIEEGLSVNSLGLWEPPLRHEKGLRYPETSEDAITSYSFLWDWMHEPYGPFWCDFKVNIWVFRFKVIEHLKPIRDITQIANLEEFLKPVPVNRRPPRIIMKGA